MFYATTSLMTLKSGIMEYPLAILAPRIGAYSETFIFRHMRDLLPEKTVVVAYMKVPSVERYWDIETPSLILSEKGLAQHDHYSRLELRVERFLKKNKVKVVLAEFLDFGLPFVKICNKIGIRYYVHAHGYDVSKFLIDPKWQKAYKNYNSAAGIITMSHKSKKDLIGIGLKKRRIHVVPYGVDIPLQKKKAKSGKLVKCLAVGRLVPKKGPLFMLESFKLACETFSDLSLDIIGDGPLKGPIIDFIRKFELEKKITLHGSKSHDFVKKSMMRSDIFLQHSITDPKDGNKEGLPVAILEAQAHSLPVISTIHAGIPEAVADGKNGYLVKERDVQEMAKRIVELASDYEQRMLIGRNGYERSKEFYSWETQRRELLSILNLTEENEKPPISWFRKSISSHI